MPRLQQVGFLVVLSILSQGCGDEGTIPTAPPTPVATSITLSSTSVTFDAIGKTAQLSASVKDQNGATMVGKTITWATSDAGIISVSSSGLVRAVSPGTVTITATHQSLSVTASATAKDDAPPSVSLITYDDSLSSAFISGVFEAAGTVRVKITVNDDHRLKKITAYVNDVEIFSDDSLTVKSTERSFDWVTHETTAVGGGYSFVVKAWDVSDNEVSRSDDIVLMNQPVITVNNLLLLPVAVTYMDQNDLYYEYVETVAAADSASKRRAFLSTDSIRLRWEVQRERKPGTNDYLGVNFAARFQPMAMTSNRIYEIDNVTSSGTYYYPLWSSAESNVYQAVPIMNMALVDEINVCYSDYYATRGYRCSVAPGAVDEDFGYYKLSTTSRVGYRKLYSSGSTSGGWYWAYSGIIDYVSEGSGALRLTVTFPDSQTDAEGLSTGGEVMPGISIKPRAAPHARRIPGAITDDRPLLRR